MLIIVLAAFYGGPDQLMPITSGLAAFFAFILIFWNKVMGFFARLTSRIRKKDASGDGTSSTACRSTDSHTTSSK